MGIWARIKAYVAADDPRVAMANFVAVVVAWNQPFYPFYIMWSVSGTIWPSFLTFLSTPFFLAVPAVSRRYPTFGRALLPLTGLANTAVSAKAFGTGSGVETFLFPIVLLGFVLFRQRERWWSAGIALLAFAIFYLRDRYGAPLHAYSPEELGNFLVLNALSAGTLTIFVGLLVSNALVSSDEPASR